MFELIVFDLDGTLVDSHRDIANAANALVEDLGGARLSDAAIAAMVGEGAALLVRRALKAAGLDPETPGALQRFLAHYDERLLEHTRPYPGTANTLAILQGQVRLSVLTNKLQRPTEQILEGLDLRQYFGEVVGGDTPSGRKPDPAGLLRLIAAAGVTPERTLMVGDSPIDLQAARNAGTSICLVRYGFGYQFGDGDFEGDELFADSPAQILDAIARARPALP